MPRLVLGIAALVGGALLAQLPDVGSSSQADQAAVRTTTAAATTTTPADRAQPSASTQPPPGTLTVVGDQPRAVHFNEVVDLPPGSQQASTRGAEASAARALVAHVPVSIQVPKPFEGRVQVTFFAESDGAREALRRDLRALNTGHAVPYAAGALERGLVEVTPGEPVVLPLRLAIPASARPSLANGLVRIVPVGEAATGSTQPAAVGSGVTVRVEGQGPQVRFAPATVNVRVTRWLGPVPCCLGRTRAGVRVLGPGAQALAARERFGFRLSDTRNGEVEGSLTFAERSGVGPAVGELRIDEANMTGKYTGAVPLDPAGPATAELPVSIEVQDAFWLPLVCLLLSAFLGGWLVNRFNQRRRREVLRAALKDAVDGYHAQRARLDDVYDVDHGLDLGGATFPTSKQAKQKDPAWGRVDSLYWEIGEAKSDDEFAAYAKTVDEIVNQIERWRRVAREFGALRDALTAYDLSDRDPARADGEDLLAEAGEDPETVAATDRLVGHLHDQHRLLRRYVELVGVWESLEDFQRDACPQCDPETAYVPLAKRTSDDERRAARVKLAQALGDARRAKLLEPPAAVSRAWARAFGGGAAATAPIVVATGGEPLGPPPAPPPREGDLRSARDILAGLVKWDYVIAIATALVTAVAFLLPKYASHTFGSWEDYVSLATLGFLGAVATGGLALNWQLFPEFRSYRPAPPRPAQQQQPPRDNR